MSTIAGDRQVPDAGTTEPDGARARPGRLAHPNGLWIPRDIRSSADELRARRAGPGGSRGDDQRDHHR